MRAWITKNWDDFNWDRLGMGLSVLCALHCVLTPLVILSLPMLARYYLVHPLFHMLLALAIIPVGLWAFISGYRHHRKAWIFLLGIPGLVLVSAVPYVVHSLHWNWNEQMLLLLGSGLLVTGHWFNRRACQSCERHASH